ncbi:MAG: ADP-ribosylglycohydrolase family protein [Caldilineaceae bacterium]|nr:ADP-ribosylglycohydrolase family protein [Caldilineaceae bacterium]MBP8109943.1 ADP-ribosylglycohydrolase family protein [Caldilineaceae bacterium]MBP8121340.1 ADP-ribosylglycohydrolase family protein [Caldilineaceae bacterium]MBP9070645.1 ADP-ribosylglycohydrolase family protein [Caldilineaceae bacterium]
MISRETLVKDRELCTDRALGSLIGLAVGDALGDLGRDNEYRNRYGIVTNLYANASSTDDTEFALLTTRTLIDCGGDLTVDAQLTAWQKYILDQGGVFERGGRPLYGAVANLQRGILPPLSGRDNVMNNDDGAAMRIAPIGILCAGQPQRAAAMAEIESQISHYADGIWAAQAVAASVAVAMVDGTPDEIIQAGLDCIPAHSWLGRAMQRAMDICDRAGSIEGAWEDLHTQLWTPVHSAAPEAVPQIYAILRMTGCDFRQGLFWGGNFGRDADTIGAVIGAVCGARQGLSVIPAEWVARVNRPKGVCLRFAAQEDITQLATQLAALIC